MRKVLSIAALSLAVLCLSASPDMAQGTKPGTKQETPPKKYGSGTPKEPVKAEPPKTEPKKTYGSGTPKVEPAKVEPPKTEPQKTYGSGTPKVEPPKVDPPKTYGSGGDKKVDPTTGKQVTPPATGPPSSKPVTPPVVTNPGTKPGGTTKYDASAGAAQKKEESKAKYIQAQKPASSYTDPKGNVHKIDEKDVKIQQLRSQLNAEKWHNRELRERQFYTVYYNRPVVVYHDPYNSFFWYWLLDRSIEDQARWAYHHRASMDAARYNDMLSKNAELAARVRALEAQNAPRDPGYVPHGMADNDLMYNQQYVQAAYNPVEVPPPPRTSTPPPAQGGSNSALTYFLVGIIIVLVLILLTWLVFFKRSGD